MAHDASGGTAGGVSNPFKDWNKASYDLPNSNINLPPGPYRNYQGFTPIYPHPVGRPSYGTAPRSGGGGGGDNYGGYSYGAPPAPKEEPITWKETYQSQNAPSWWRGYTPSRLTPESEFASLVNAMIPFMSPEDAKATGNDLSRMFSGTGGYPFAGYSNTPPNTPEVTGSTADQYLSKSRADALLGALDRMASSMGKGAKDFGPGYKFIQQLAGALKDFGGESATNRMTRANYVKYMGALDPLIANTKGETLGAFGSAAQMFARPFFSGGLMVPVSKDENGNYVFGKANTGWY